LNTNIAIMVFIEEVRIRLVVEFDVVSKVVMYCRAVYFEP